MAPFADNTSVMFAEAAKVNRRFRLMHLRPYADVPEAAEFNRHGEPLKTALSGIVTYSNQLVALNGAPKPDREKNRLLAVYLDEAMSRAATRRKLDEIGVTAGLRDSTLVAIRDADTFLGGIGAASPLVNAVVAAVLDGLDALSAEIPVLTNAIEASIEANFHEKRVAYEGLTRLQARYLVAATYLYEARSGNAAAADSLVAVDASLSVFMPARGRASPEQLDAAEAALTERLGRIAGMIEQLSTARATYSATNQELEDLRVNLDMRIKVARDAVVIWGQSHRNLGAGIPVPPLINLSAVAAGVADAVPFP